MENISGHIHEVFGSFQGEGAFVGERHIFVRFSGCNLKCAYCDTKDALVFQPEARLEQGPGKGVVSLQNPLSVSAVMEAVNAQEIRPGFNSAVCFTGGEPLCQPVFLAALLDEMNREFRVMLETNGTLPEALESVRPMVDIVSMDIKLPSVSGIEGLWTAHEEFLKVCRGKELIVKAVVGPKTPPDEVARAVRMVGGIDRDACFVLQPLTPEDGFPEAGNWLFDLYSISQKFTPKVRVIPQVHKFLKVK